MLPPSINALCLADRVAARLRDVLIKLNIVSGTPATTDEAELVGANWRRALVAFRGPSVMLGGAAPFSVVSAQLDDGVIAIGIEDKKARPLVLRVAFDREDRVRLLSLSRPVP